MRRVALALCFLLLGPLHPVRGQSTPATSDQPTAAATAGDPAGDDIGADALMFEVTFWIRLLQGDAGLIRTDVRHRIDDLFREAGLHMTAPRRDVRLVEGGPLDVRVMKD